MSAGRRSEFGDEVIGSEQDMQKNITFNGSSSDGEFTRSRDMLETSSQRPAFRVRHRQRLKDHRTSFNRFRLFCGKIVNNEVIQIGMILLIMVNAIFMGVATFDFVANSQNTQDLFNNIDRGFLIIYTVELSFQFVYFGWHLVLDSWLLFDLVVIAISWAFEIQGGGGNQFQIIRAFRIFRAFRLLTRIKVLRDLVSAIGQVIPRMSAISMLLVIVFYIFAVLFTELFGQLELSDNFFTTLDASLFTCYEMMTLEWAGIAREVMVTYKWAWAPFFGFIWITGFIVFNLIIAVICDAVSIIDKVAKEREARARGELLETTEQKLDYAQQRIDVMADRIESLVKSQGEIQGMMELLATEMYQVEHSGFGSKHQRGD